jgi:hypothetical protein
MPRAAKLLAVLFVTALGSAGCVGTGRNAPTPQATASVTVQNQAFIDVDVFAVYSGTRARLGSVTAGNTTTFRIPTAVLGSGRDLVFVVDPIGSRRQGASYNMFVRPGEHVSLTIPASIAQ